MSSHHASHKDIIARLKRADGHLQGIIEMLQSGRPCLDIAQQLQAVEKAINKAKKTLIHDHIDHCLEHAVKDGDKAAMAEFKTITKYL